MVTEQSFRIPNLLVIILSADTHVEYSSLTIIAPPLHPSYDMVSTRKTIWCCRDIWWKSCVGFLREIERGKVVFALSIRPK